VESNLDDQEDVDDNEKDIDINGGSGLIQMESESPVEPVMTVPPIMPETCETSDDAPPARQSPNVSVETVPKKEPSITSPGKDGTRVAIISPEPVESSTPVVEDTPVVVAVPEEEVVTNSSVGANKTFSYANLVKGGSAAKPPPHRPPQTVHSSPATNVKSNHGPGGNATVVRFFYFLRTILISFVYIYVSCFVITFVFYV